MEIRIGIQNVNRELSFESAESKEAIETRIEAALVGEQQILKFNDSKGKLILVDTDSIAYIEIGAEESRKIGFVG